MLRQGAKHIFSFSIRNTGIAVQLDASHHLSKGDYHQTQLMPVEHDWGNLMTRARRARMQDHNGQSYKPFEGNSVWSDHCSNENERLLGIVTAVAIENATDSLVRAGFPASDVCVLLPESLGGPKDIGTEKATKAPEHEMAGVTP